MKGKTTMLTIKDKHRRHEEKSGNSKDGECRGRQAGGLVNWL